MSIKIILKVAGLHNVEEICDTANNGREAVDIIEEDVTKKGKSSYALILMD